MASGKVVGSQLPFDLGLGSSYSNADTCKHVVNQNIVFVTLANPVSGERAWHLLGLLDALRHQMLTPDLFGLLLHVADKLFREFALIQSKVEVACCEGGWFEASTGQSEWCYVSGVAWWTMVEVGETHG